MPVCVECGGDVAKENGPIGGGPEVNSGQCPHCDEYFAWVCEICMMIQGHCCQGKQIERSEARELEDGKVYCIHCREVINGHKGEKYEGEIPAVV